MRFGRPGGALRRGWAAGLALLLCLLGGCAPLSLDLQSMEEDVSLPEVTDSVPAPPVSDHIGGMLTEATVYYLSTDLQQLTPVRRILYIAEGETLARRAVESQLTPPASADLKAITPVGTRLLGMETTGDVLTVNLSAEALHTESEQQALTMRAAIANTLLGLSGVSGVSILIDGKETGLLSLPTGVSRGYDSDVASQMAQWTAEAESFLHGADASRYLEREALVYYASTDGAHIYGEARTLRFTSEREYLKVLIDALTEAPSSSCARSPFPENASALIKSYELVTTPDGQTAARIVFEASLLTEMERAGLVPWQLYAALSYTLTSFIPEVDAVILFVGEGQIIRTARNGTEILFEGGMMLRAHFQSAVGCLTPVYYVSADGGLTRTLRLMDHTAVHSPRALLGAAMQREAEARSAFPAGISEADILAVCVENGTALVNLSENFRLCCQNLSPEAERNLVYAMVNTLCELPFVRAARFYVEGESVESLSGHIYLRGELLPNPGLASE